MFEHLKLGTTSIRLYSYQELWNINMYLHIEIARGPKTTHFHGPVMEIMISACAFQSFGSACVIFLKILNPKNGFQSYMILVFFFNALKWQNSQGHRTMQSSNWAWIFYRLYFLVLKNIYIQPLFNLAQNDPVGICRVLFLNSTFQNLLDFSFVRCHNLIPIQKLIKMSFPFRSSISREWKIKDFKDDIASSPLA